MRGGDEKLTGQPANRICESFKLQNFPKHYAASELTCSFLESDKFSLSSKSLSLKTKCEVKQKVFKDTVKVSLSPSPKSASHVFPSCCRHHLWHTCRTIPHNTLRFTKKHTQKHSVRLTFLILSASVPFTDGVYVVLPESNFQPPVSFNFDRS